MLLLIYLMRYTLRMKKLLKNWNLFEILLLTLSTVLVVVFFLIGKDKNYLSLFTSIVGIVSVILLAKGMVLAPIIGIAYNVLYTIISITQHYYGEAIIYIFLQMPISILSIVQWLKNRSQQNKDLVQVNKVTAKEYLYLVISTVFLTVAFYFLLKALNTSELIISTISLITSIVAAYLSLRRSPYYAVVYFFNDIILITMWSISTYKFGLQYLPTVLSFCIFLINDIYAFFHWKWQERKQRFYQQFNQEFGFDDEGNIVLKDILLRKAKFDDYVDLYNNYWSNKITTQYMLWQVSENLNEAKQRIQRTIDFQSKTPISFVICQKSNNMPIGLVGFKEIEKDVYEDVGLGIGTNYVKKGYGTQVLQAILKFLFENKNAKKVKTGAFKQNVASIKMQKRCGLKKVGKSVHTRQYDNLKYTEICFEMTKENYNALKAKYLK